VTICDLVAVTAADDTRTGEVEAAAEVVETGAGLVGMAATELLDEDLAVPDFPTIPRSPEGLFLFMAGMVIVSIVQTDPSLLGVKLEKEASPPAPMVSRYDMLPFSRTILVS
jgi:hypothetical protein